MRWYGEARHQDQYPTLFEEWQGMFYVQCPVDRALCIQPLKALLRAQGDKVRHPNPAIVFAARRYLVDPTPNGNQTHNVHHLVSAAWCPYHRLL